MLVVDVEDSEARTRREFRFSRSPVRVGRSPLNELALSKGFVSHCHGVLHFDANGPRFVDLGSTNGSVLDDRRLVPNVPEPLGGGSCLLIGSLTLRVRVEGPVAAVDARDSSPPGFSTPAAESLAPGWGGVPPVSVGNVATGHPTPRGAESSAPAPEPTGEEHLLRSVSLHPDTALRKGYDQYRAAWYALRDQLNLVCGSLPASDREAAAALLLAQFPDLAQEAEFRRMMGTERISRAPAQPAGSDAAERRLLSRFAAILIEMRNSQRAFRKEMALSLSPSERAVEAHDSGDALLGYLLEPGRAEERLEELSRAFADLMLHQVALVNAVRSGMKEVLEPLDPNELALRGGGVVGYLMRLLGRDARWRALRVEFDNLREESVLSARLFGRAFSRAYTAVMGGASQSKAEPTVPTQS